MADHTSQVTSEHSIYDFTRELTPQKPIDILLNIAGIMAPKDSDSLKNIDYQTMLSTFSVNTFGPLLLTSALLPNLKLSAEPKIGIMSSRVGSIADNSSGGSYAYRASKTAVNSIGKNLAVELKEENIPVVLMHPGFVVSGLDKTDSTRNNPEAVQPEEAARKLWKVLKSKGIEETGRFWHREGMELPW